MASLLLKLPGAKVHDIQDDIESFVHVTMYIGLRYLPHNMLARLPDIMRSLFDSQDQSPDGLVRGGYQKFSNFFDQSITSPELLFRRNEPPIAPQRLSLTITTTTQRGLFDAVPIRSYTNALII